ncbi:MAG: hypothetical protein RL199_155 [Pseudomonadota bacterium]|jgi:hypothetical protein
MSTPLMPPRDRRAADGALVVVLGVLSLGALLLLMRQTVRGIVNQDEFQHAHIAWLTLRGKLVYRDFFEHHGPLHAFWNAALMAVAGARPSTATLLMLRWCSLGYVVASAATVAMVVRRAGAGWRLAWSAGVLHLSSGVVTTYGVQPRPDGLYALVLLLAVAFAQRRRFGITGLLLGLAVGLHPKAVIPVAALLAALVPGARAEGLSPAETVRRLAKTVLASLVVPVGLAFLFLGAGALDAFVQGMFGYNVEAFLSPAVVKPERTPFGFLFLCDPHMLAAVVGGTVLAVAGVCARPAVDSGRTLLAWTVLLTLPMFFMKSYPHVLLWPIPLVLLATALVEARHQHVAAWVVTAAVLAGLVHNAARLKLAPAGHREEQEEDIAAVRAADAAGDRGAYVWPSRCAGYVFRDEQAWMWLPSRVFGVSGMVTATDELSRRAYKDLFTQVEHQELDWVLLDQRELDAMVPADVAVLERNYRREHGCLWRRRQP